MLLHHDISYENGRGLQKDLNLSAHFYRLSAAQYYVATQYNPEVMIANGKGVTRDLEKALA